MRMCSLQDFSLERDLKTTYWHDWLANDVAYAHAAMAVSCAAQDFLLGKPLSKTGLYHAAKTVSYLNQYLSDPVLALEN